MGPHPGRCLQRKKLIVRTFGDLKAALAKPQSEAKAPAAPPKLMTAAKAASPPRAACGLPKPSSDEAERIAVRRAPRFAALLWLQETFPLVFDPS